MVSKVAIVGLGLIGGSLGLALQKKGLVETVVGIPRRPETIDEALSIKAITKGTLSIAEGVREADIIFICTPISLVIPKLKEILPHVKKGAIITDVGSTKAYIVDEADKIVPPGINFIGGHPMAGKEKTGILAADAKLFNKRAYVLVKTKRTHAMAYNALKKIIQGLGGKVMEMDAKNHDLAVAAISHLPIVVASSLVNAVNETGDIKDKAKSLAATGFGDSTRIASGDPKLGLDIFRTNAESVLQVLSKFKREIDLFEKALQEKDEVQIMNKLSGAKKFRDSIYS